MLPQKPKGKPKRGTQQRRRWILLVLIFVVAAFGFYVVLAPVMPATPPGGHVYPAPNERYFVVATGIATANNLVPRLSLTDGKRSAGIIIGWMNTSFHGWSANSRYAIFRGSNQYGITDLMIFDTQTWATVTRDGCQASMSPCYLENPVTNNGHWLLVGDGSILDFDDELREIARVTIPKQHYLSAGSWSPDASQLVLVMTELDGYSSADYLLPHVYLADGLGKDAVEVGQLEEYANATDWAWDEDGQHVMITSYVSLAQSWTTLYELDMAAGRLTLLP